MYYPWLKFDFIYFKLIIINYHTQRQKKIKFTSKIKNTQKKTLHIIHVGRVESWFKLHGKFHRGNEILFWKYSPTPYTEISQNVAEISN